MPIPDPHALVAISATLYADWRLPATEGTGPWLRRTPLEPGTIALRARWHYLRGLDCRPPEPEAHLISEDQWQLEIDLETEGDVALVRHDLDTASDRFSRLRDVASHPVALAEALIGLADVARHADDMTLAQRFYRHALQVADEHGFAFGALRARLPLAYLVRRGGSAEEMLTMAQECEDAARHLADRVYVANAQVAQGEALDLLGRRDEAVQVLAAAMDEFTAIGTAVGVASAGVRLLDVHRRREDATAILRVAPVVMRAIEATQQLQEAVDIYDVLAYAHLQRDELDEALAVCRSGMALAEQRYPRAAAHLRMTEVVALRKLGRVDEAVQTGLQAYDYFRDRPDDQGTAANCLGHLADCAELLDDLDEAAELRLRAIEAVEQMRSRQRRPRWQQEYRDRFDAVYRGALRTMVRAADPQGFTAVFESLWGRRLAGVGEGVRLDPTTDPLLIAQLLARNDQARRAGLPVGAEPGEKLVRGLGRVALSGSLPEMYADATDPALAASYRPLRRDQGMGLLDAIRPDIALLLIAELPGRPGRIVWLARRPHDRPMLGLRELDPGELDLIEQWSGTWSTTATAKDVAPLAGLIPSVLRELPEQARLQLIPLERLWSLPWAALPVSAGFLGATTKLLLSPSLSLARPGGPALGAGCPTGPDTVCRIGPGVRHHRLRGLGRAAAHAGDPAAAGRAYRALIRGGADAVVILAHGRPVPGLGHYLEVSVDLTLTPTELLNATPPESLALLACWGAQVPGKAVGEPLTLATIALARGSRQVLTTVGELGDTPSAVALVDDVVFRAGKSPWPEALHWALNRRAADLVDEPLVDWAALTALGGW